LLQGFFIFYGLNLQLTAHFDQKLLIFGAKPKQAGNQTSTVGTTNIFSG
jgi:hypothetical protein